MRTLISFFSLLTLACFAFLAPLSAQEEAGDTPTVTPSEQNGSDLANDIRRDLNLEDYSFAHEFLNMLSTLGVFLLALLALAWLLRRVRQTRVDQINLSSAIKIIERRILAPKGVLYLVDVEGQRMVLSESPAGIHYITSLNQEPAAKVEEERSFEEVMREQEGQAR